MTDHRLMLCSLPREGGAPVDSITGQVQPIPLLVTQQSSSSGGGFPANSTLAVWQLGVEHPGDIICVGPKR